MIAPKLKGEKRSLLNVCVCKNISFSFRPKVLVAICDLFSLLPTLEVDETLQPLRDTALTFLWNCTASSVREKLNLVTT